MVPALTNGGKSFKGAAAYYLHDKRQAGEAVRETADRVAWTETVNLLTDDPDKAWRMMATTAMKAEELKAAAGIKATGRKLTTPVLAYSLSWSPTERPTREQQSAAARETIDRLGLSEHQAVIVAHNDEPHAHVHVLVNRVHPATGKAATLSNSKRTLSDWALAYEQQQGKIQCPKRQQNAEARKQGKKVEQEPRPAKKPEAGKDTANDSLRQAFIRTDQQQRDAQLSARERAMKESHQKQWAALKATYEESKAKLYGFGDALRKQKADQMKEAHKPEWRELFKRQRREEVAFERRNNSTLGRFKNIAEAVAASGWKEGTGKDILGAVFGRASGHARAVFVAGQEAERHKLAEQVKQHTARAVEPIRESVKADVTRLREDYLAGCDGLRNQQRDDRADIRDAWKQRGIDRAAALDGSMMEPGRTPDQSMGRGQGMEQGRSMTRDYTPRR